jgi:SAM-dependent methyltransferase
MENMRKLEHCRLCGVSLLARILDFGEVPLGNNLQEDISAARAAPKYPLELLRCSNCGHFQLGHAVAPEELYATNYTYLSGIGASFLKHFAEYAEWASQKCGLPLGATVVDVGSNDGTCLKAFQDRGYKVCGVDPASLPARIANEKGIRTINAFFDGPTVDRILSDYGPVDFVTSHNVLAHVDDLAGTLTCIRRVLKPGGHLCFEVGYFREVLQKDLFDTIYHEHLDYHHAVPLVRHLTGLGFVVEDLSVNAVQGGSIRVLCRNGGGGGVSASAREFLAQEQTSIVSDQLHIANWERTIQAKMRDFRSRLENDTVSGRSIAGFGAPTKAVLLMKIAGISERHIKYVVEDNELKVGRFLPSTGIPILRTTQLHSDTPDVLVIFAWNFAQDILAKLKGRFNKPVSVIVPLPKALTVEL